MEHPKEKKQHLNLYWLFLQDQAEHPAPPPLVSKIQKEIHAILLQRMKIKGCGE